MASVKKGEHVAFKVNPLGNGVVLGVGTITKPGHRVSTLTVQSVQKTPYIVTGQELILANTMICPLTALNLP